ncbi:MAG: glycoside hydrolase family 44 protein [Candidatus Nanopelagicales bacterium]
MRAPHRRTAALTAAAALVAAGAVVLPSTTATAAAVAGPALAIDVATAGPTISDDVYGASFPTAAFAAAARLPLHRWGGNSTSRYDYRTDDYNTGSDWYFENLRWEGGSASTGGPSALDAFVSTATSSSARAAVTVPVNGWVAKDNRVSCGFPTSVFGTQESTDYWWPTCGNGRANGKDLTPLAATQTSTAFTTSDMTAMAAHLHANAPAGTEPIVYQLDNEPSLWSSTHRDVSPTPWTGASFFAKSTAAADAIVAGDPSAQVSGPGDWGWCAYFYFPKDGCGDGADRTATGSIDLGAAYLKAFHDHDVLVGHRTLAVLDEHFYPQGDGIALTTAGDAAHQAARLRSTRALWDPTYTDESWIATVGVNEQVMLIPRMKAWIQQYYPGTGIAIGEYNFGGLESMNGALAQADVLGILGREGVTWAALWGAPDSATAPGTFAFRMYRDLDGAGTSFGSHSVKATSADQGRLSVYAATRDDGTVTAVVVNKTASDLSSAVTVSGASLAPTAQAYRYSAADLTRITTSSVAMSPSSTMTFPAQSITTLVMPLSTAASSSLAFTASPTTTTYPARTTLTATLTSSAAPVPGAPVAFYARLKGTTTWKLLTTTTTGADGTAVARTAPSGSTEYVVLDRSAATSQRLPAPMSAVRRVDVARAATLSLSVARVRLGSNVTFAGRISPAGPAHRVTLQRRVGTTWVAVATTYTRAYSSSASTWSLVVKQSWRGTQTYRAVVAGDALHLAGVTATRTVTVV